MMPLADQPDDLGIIVVGHVLGADLHQPALAAGRLLNLLGQLELAPVGQRLLAIDVLAGMDRVDGLGRVQAVRGRDADDVDVGIGQECLVLHVHLGPAGLLAGGLESGTVDVADRDRLGLALLLQSC